MKKFFLLALILCISLSLCLMGCGRIAEKMTQNITENVAENFAEKLIESNSGEDVDINFNDGGISIETEDGTLNTTEDGEGMVIETKNADGTVSTMTTGENASLPEGYPENLLPLLKQEQLFLSAVSGSSYTVGFTSNADPTEATEYYQSLLENDGTLDSSMIAEDGTLLIGSIGDVPSVTISIALNQDGSKNGQTMITIITGE